MARELIAGSIFDVVELVNGQIRCTALEPDMMGLTVKVLSRKSLEAMLNRLVPFIRDLRKEDVETNEN